MVGLGFTALLRLAWLAATVPILVVSLPIRPVGFLHRMIMGSFRMLIKIKSDFCYIVAYCPVWAGSLRENKGADEYVIPYGDWFRYVSCPHYLAEIVILVLLVLSYTLESWLQAEDRILQYGFFSCLWYVSNLTFAAAETHRWYHRKFENYPKTRRAIIPFVY
ncbi:hypothetical protein GW17_00005216 [Ensete ventricosum]|nr:hypothetical protein GW17_00005216 [Ensete ventricosum]